jgi:hypothetical protein
MSLLVEEGVWGVIAELELSDFVAGGLIALAASGITMGGTYAIERARWSREEKRYMQQQRLLAYTRFLAAIYLILSDDPNAPPADSDEALRDAVNALAELDILAPPPVKEAASELRAAVSLKPKPGEGTEAYSQRRGKAVDAKREAFAEAVKEDLGISPPDPTPVE